MEINLSCIELLVGVAQDVDGGRRLVMVKMNAEEVARTPLSS